MLPFLLALLGVATVALVVTTKKPALPPPPPVKAPPKPPTRRAKITPPTLDANIPYRLAHAVAVSLALENDHDKLQKFAKATSEFPIAKGLLLAKAHIASAAKVSVQRPASLSAEEAKAVHDAARATGKDTPLSVLARYPKVPRNARINDAIQNERAKLVAESNHPTSWKGLEANPFASAKTLYDAQERLGVPPIELIRKFEGNPQLTIKPGATADAYTILEPVTGSQSIHITSRGLKAASEKATAMLTGSNDPAYQAYLRGPAIPNPVAPGTSLPKLDYPAWKRTQDPAWVAMQKKLEAAKEAALAKIRQEEEKARHRSRGLFSKIGDALSDATKGLGSSVQDAMKVADKIPLLNAVNPFAYEGKIAAKFLSDVAQGKNVAASLKEETTKGMTDAVKDIKAAAPYLSYVPGIGQGAAAVVAAGAGLALGEPINQAALDSVSASLPGAPVSQAAFGAGTKAAEAIAQGKKASDVALAAARGALPNDQAKAAFDAGLALARGKNLQEAGFAALRGLCPGNDLAQKAEHFTEALVKAKETGKSVKDVLEDQLIENVGKLGSNAASEQLRPLLSAMSSSPALANMTETELAKARGVPVEVARAALAATKPLTDKMRILDPSLVRKLLPEPAKALPAALPADKAAAIKRLAQTGHPDAKTVQKALEVAEMRKQQDQWIAYYNEVERKAS